MEIEKIEYFLNECNFENKLKFNNGFALLTNDNNSVSLELPIFDAESIFRQKPIKEERNEIEKEVISVWNKTGMILIRNFLDQSTISSLHDHALEKLTKGADPGDHFRTTEIKTGFEGRGWAQRQAIRERSPALLAKVLESSKKLQQLIFGDISTTTEIQFNATYSPDVGHIHIDRPAGFLSMSEAKYIEPRLLEAMNRCSFQTAFYTGETPRSKGSTGFIPGSHRLLENGLNTINIYNSISLQVS